MSIGGKIVVGVVVAAALFGAYKWATRNKGSNPRNTHPMSPANSAPHATMNVNNVAPVATTSQAPKTRG